MTRYARQIQLPDVGADGQAKLAAAHVVVIGAGGLGCPALQYLTGAGVGQITLLDPDIVEESNLHRQPLYRMQDLGQPKAQAAADALRALNPHVHITPRCTPLGPGLAPDLVARADVIIDAADSYAVSYILSDACLAAATPLVCASVLGQTGYVGAFCAGAPSLRAVFPDLPPIADTCASAGVLGPVVGVIGALQAQIALRILLGAAPSAMGQLVTVDLAALTFGGFRFCNSAEPLGAIPFIAQDWIRDSDLVLDLRHPDEAPDMISPHAQRITHSALQTLRCDHSDRIVLCCTSGHRAWHGAQTLRARGASNLALLAARACT